MPTRRQTFLLYPFWGSKHKELRGAVPGLVMASLAAVAAARALARCWGNPRAHHRWKMGHKRVL